MLVNKSLIFNQQKRHFSLFPTIFIKKYKYSQGNDTEKFYTWLETMVIPIKLKNYSYYETESIIKEIRKIIYQCVNESSGCYDFSSHYIERFLETNQFTIEETYQVKKEFRKRVELANKMGKRKILEYYHQNEIPQIFLGNRE